MRIRIAAAVAVCTALAAAAVAAPPAGAVTAGRLTQAARLAQPARLAQSPRQIATADAASLLASFRSPPGARSSGPIAVSSLSSVPTPGSPDLVSRTAWWQVPGTMDGVLAWVRAHRPAGTSFGGSGRTADASGIISMFDEFSRPAVTGVLAGRSLYVTVASDGPQRVALRVDSEVTWLPRKSPAERVPAAARVVTITGLPALGSTGPVRPIGHFYPPVTVTSRATVTKIAAVVDGLSLMPPGVFSCPFSNGQGLRLVFRAAKGGPVLAEVTADMNGCGTVLLTVDGKPMPALWGGAGMAARVLKLAHIHWAGF